MKLRYFKTLLPVSVMAMMSLTACVGDLDVNPEIDPKTNTTFQADATFNKVYANLGLTGRQAPAGMPDLEGKDEGSSGFIRVLWNSNELPTDEAICGWSDGGILGMTTNQWDASNDFINLLYYRLMYGVSVANHYLEQTDAATDAETVLRRAEVRFLRALHFYHLMDAFGNIPTPMAITDELPKQNTRKEAYALIEKELLECVTDMKDPRANTYGRADKAAAWMLLARLYLNAEVYTGTAQWDKAAEYAKKVMDAGYTLTPNYAYLFMGDNHTNGAQNEMILPVLQDGIKTFSYSGSTFLIASTRNSDMTANTGSWGTSEAWGGNRCRPELIKTFVPENTEATTADVKTAADMIKIAKDDRAMFYSADRKFENTKIGTFKDGYSCLKWTGLYSTGTSGSDTKFADTDVPLMRVAEAYLTYAEAKFRANGEKSTTEVADAINALRTRANAAKQMAYTKQEILNEWQKEFYFEGRRRIDLIRFGKFGGYSNDYVWSWKNGVKAGSNFDVTRNIFPIPAEEMNANYLLVQNPGYNGNK